MANRLERELGLLETTFYGVGIILGAGIYVLIGEAAGLAGNMTWAAFLFGALIATFTGLSYAELSSMFPKSGGEVVYVHKAFGKRLAFLIGWMIIVGGVIASATVALGFSGYFKSLFGAPILLTAAVLIAILSVVNFIGIRESAIFNIVFTAVEAAGLLLIIWLGRNFIGRVDYFELPPMGFSGVMAASALIFFAYLGFEDLVRLSEETKNARKVIPQALILSVIISTVLYIFVAISTVSILGYEKLAESSAPLADVAAAALGPNAYYLLSVIALFATANTVLIMLIATSRLMYGMAQDSTLPVKSLAKVHSKTHTPTLAIILVAVFSAAFLFFKDVAIVASLTDIALFLTFAVVNLTLIWLRYKMPRRRRLFKSPVNIGNFSVLALLGAISSILMLAYFDLEVLLMGAALVLTGVIAGELARNYNSRSR